MHPQALRPLLAILIVGVMTPAAGPLLAAGDARQWWPRPYPPPPMWYAGTSVAVRVDVEPTDAEVYVDGYLAGRVDDFDGVFQRLRLRPGEHEITIYLAGYRTIVERRYFNPNASMTIRRSMEPLAAGETAEPPPEPVAPPAGGRAGEPPQYPPRPEPPPRRERPAPMGTLALRVTPADAQILIDGKAQPAAPADGPASLRLAPGRYTLEVRRDGYVPYVEDVLIRPGATLSLTVTLTPR